MFYLRQNYLLKMSKYFIFPLKERVNNLTATKSFYKTCNLFIAPKPQSLEPLPCSFRKLKCRAGEQTVQPHSKHKTGFFISQCDQSFQYSESKQASLLSYRWQTALCPEHCTKPRSLEPNMHGRGPAWKGRVGKRLEAAGSVEKRLNSGQSFPNSKRVLCLWHSV